MTSNEERWKRRIDRERKARKEAEQLLEEKSQALYQAHVELEKSSQAALADKERRYSTLFECSLDGIVIHDTEGRIIESNRELTKLLGYDGAMLRSMKIADLLPVDWREEAGPELIQRIFEQGSHRFETVLLRCDNSQFPAEISANKFLSGSKVFAQWVIRDVTKRNKTFEELRTAKEAAEHSNRAKSTFLANMSHEIRTPLNGIIGVAELLNGTDLSDNQAELAETILTSGENLLDIINDILDFSKIESEKLVLENAPFSLADCLVRAFSSITSTAAQKELEVACFIDPELPDHYQGDIVRLRQVIANLLGNAVKFTAQGEIYLSIKPIGLIGDQTQQMEIEVRDTGIGIAEEDVEKLFDKFTQVDASTTRKYGGTGLGLAISKRIIETMGGEISVSSQIGKGSSFKIRLNLPIATDSVEKDASTTKLKGLQVLIVDDNETNRRIMAHQCQYLGLDCTVFESASSALDFLNKKEACFDIGLLDMQMPEIDGLELALKIRQMQAHESIPLVLATPLGGNEPTVENEDWPFDGCLYKPILLAPLQSTLLKALSEDHKATKASLPEPKPVPTNTKPIRVLIAEDNPINLRVANNMLKKLGYQTDTATNGKEVIALMENGETYDVILMDGHMPEMDGRATTQAIRKQFPESKVSIVALTADAMQGDREKYIAAGMDDYISKPLRTEELQDALARIHAPKKA